MVALGLGAAAPAWGAGEPYYAPDPDDYRVQEVVGPSCTVDRVTVRIAYHGDTAEIAVGLIAGGRSEASQERVQPGSVLTLRGQPLAFGQSRGYRINTSFLDDHSGFTTLREFTAGRPTARACADRPPRFAAPKPVEVRLGAHRFGALSAPDAVVARVDAGGVGWEEPAEGAAFGPWSFEIAADGGVWVLDQLNKRLLGWRPGRPDSPARVVTLPVFAADFALGPNGTFYLTASGTPSEKTMFLLSITAEGEVRWRVPVATDLFNAQLRTGPDGVLYNVSPAGWIPVATSAGAPLSLAEQRRRTQAYQPLPGGGRLVVAYSSRREVQVTVLDATGRPLRAWRVTGATDMAPPGGALPALVDGDPVLPLDVFAEAPTWRLEQLGLRLTASGAAVRLHLDNAVWGDKPITEYRVGPGGAFYQLRTSRTTGVTIVRYNLGPVPPAEGAAAHTPTVTASAPAKPTATASQPAALPAMTPPVTAGARHPTEPSNGTALAWAAGIGLTIIGAAGSALLMWRRRHRTPS